MPNIQLQGGEQDGYQSPINSVTTRPNIFYAVPLIHEDLVKATKGVKARTALREKLATLAYAYEKTVRKDKVGWEYVYVRAPELDKEPATKPESADGTS